MHDDEFVVGENCPSSHAVQLLEDDAEILPAAQLPQSFTLSCKVSLVASSARKYPAAQDLHAVEFVASWYFPLTQIEQDVAEIKTGAFLPIGQAVHA